MFDRKTIWLLLFLLSVFGSSSAHAFLGKNRIGDFTPEHSSLYDLRRSAEDIRTQITDSDGVITYVTDPHGSLSRVLSCTKDGQITRYVYGVGLQYEVDSNGSAIYYHFDHIGNTAALTDESENVIDEFRYSPYGTVTYQKNNYETPFQFGGFFGVQTDSNGLVHMRARYFNPLIRRFVNSDPARDAWNWFAYANGNPIFFVDPSGLEPSPSNSSNVGNLESLGFSANVKIRSMIAENARSYQGSTDWNYDVENGNFPAGSNKCNLFCYDVLTESGASPERPNGNSVRRLFGGGYPPTAEQWADSNYDIPGWEPLSANQTPMAGDVAAQQINYSDATGHVAIVTDERLTTGTSSVPPESIKQSNWGFRPSQSGQVIFRRWKGSD